MTFIFNLLIIFYTNYWCVELFEECWVSVLRQMEFCRAVALPFKGPYSHQRAESRLRWAAAFTVKSGGGGSAKQIRKIRRWCFCAWGCVWVCWVCVCVSLPSSIQSDPDSIQGEDRRRSRRQDAGIAVTFLNKYCHPFEGVTINKRYQECCTAQIFLGWKLLLYYTKRDTFMKRKKKIKNKERISN